MALNKAQLAADMQAILSDGQGGAKTQAQVAQAIADAMDAFVWSGMAITTVMRTCSIL